jgi:hypothetical protein
MYFTLRLHDSEHEAGQAGARAYIGNRPILGQERLQLRAIGNVSLVYFGGSFG